MLPNSVLYTSLGGWKDWRAMGRKGPQRAFHKIYILCKGLLSVCSISREGVPSRLYVGICANIRAGLDWQCLQISHLTHRMIPKYRQGVRRRSPISNLSYFLHILYEVPQPAASASCVTGSRGGGVLVSLWNVVNNGMQKMPNSVCAQL
jgi:hypothetical protein